MIFGDYVCCSMGFGTLVRVFVFCVMWLLITESGVCVHISGED